MNDRCRIPKCRRVGDLRYLGKWICWEHWVRLAERTEKLRGLLKIRKSAKRGA